MTDQRPPTPSHSLWHDVRDFQRDNRYQEAVNTLRKLVDSGDTYAMVHLGWMTLHGHGTERDEDGALALYNAALDAGEIEASIALGQYFSAREQWAAAREHYETAARAGALVAAYRLGIHREYDYAAAGARDWLSVAAESRHIWASAALARRLWRSGVWRNRLSGIRIALRITIDIYFAVMESREGESDAHPRLRK